MKLHGLRFNGDEETPWIGEKENGEFYLATEVDEQIKRLRAELTEYIRAEEALIAAGLISKAKVEQAHDLVRSF